MDGTNVFDAHIRGGGNMLNALVAEALASPAAPQWTDDDDEDHYVQVVIAVMDDGLSFDAACNAVGARVGRASGSLRPAMAKIALREDATAELGA